MEELGDVIKNTKEQRKRKNELNTEKKIKLDSLEGWSWTGPYDGRKIIQTSFEEKIEALKLFYKKTIIQRFLIKNLLKN